jgi:hypothetical protein
VTPQPTDVATAADLKGHVARIQDVMHSVMIKNTHYGVIPGTGKDAKPTLLKPGAEVLCMAFHIAPSFNVLDLGDRECRRYRVRCVGTHQGTARTLGEGVGECSSDEEKYKWRAARGRREYELADVDRRRIKFYGDKEVPQVRIEPADIANTVLKMASKRAHVAMVLNVLAASDMFTQDTEDDVADADADEQRTSSKPATREPQEAPGPGATVDPAQIKMLRAKMSSAGVAESLVLAQFELGSIEQLPFHQINKALGWIDANGHE